MKNKGDTPRQGIGRKTEEGKREQNKVRMEDGIFSYQAILDVTTTFRKKKCYLKKLIACIWQNPFSDHCTNFPLTWLRYLLLDE